jgi:hypothetical protein
MHSPSQTEHFVTLFDSHYLPQGMCLHQSLLEHGASFHLWIVAMDAEAAQCLRRLALPHVSVIELGAVETERLLSVKQDRSVGEYCWTLTPFVIGHVLEAGSEVDRVTYLDADLFFFDNYASLFDEFEQSGKHVLLTEHAFAPEYQDNLRFGRFCVQFMTFRKTEEGSRVLGWWRDRCAEWCFARLEDGKFGDQKYLDEWPAMFGDAVHVLENTQRTLAPWNAHYFERISPEPLAPVFYHFHGLRILPNRRVTLYSGYRIGRAGFDLYRSYLRVLNNSVALLRRDGMESRPFAGNSGLRANLGRWKRTILGTEKHALLGS